MKDRSWFLDHLQKQIEFIDHSCASFDAGYENEAIRIAVSLRILLHDTNKSTSLLRHLGATNISLLSTVPQVSSTAFAFDGLTTFTGAGPRAKLRTPSNSRQLLAREWWEQIVYVGGGKRLSRKAVVLGAANQDGGAHVDPKLNAAYEMLLQNFWIEHRGDKSSVPLQTIHLLGLRQMGYEVLQSEQLKALATEA